METYVYRNPKSGEEFEIAQVGACQIRVSYQGYSGTISPMAGLFHAVLDGSGPKCPDLKSALDQLCGALIERAKRPPNDDLCKQIDDFYNSVK